MPWPTEPPADAVELFTRERAVLLEFLEARPAEDWARPSPCPGWSVLGLTTHLLGDDLSLIARHRDGYLGTVPPAGTSAEGFVTWLDALQDEWVHAARRLSPPLVLQLLRWTGPQLVEVLRAQDPAAVTADVSWAGDEPAPVWLDQLREVSEYWIHRQQLRWALGFDTDLDRAVLAPLLEAFKWAYPYRLRGHGRPGDAVTIEIVGDVEARWTLVASATGWDFAAASGPPAARMRLTADQAWRLLTNNLPPEQQRGIDATGSRSIVDALLRTRAIIGAPNA